MHMPQAIHGLLDRARFRGFLLGFCALVPTLVLEESLGNAGKQVSRIGALVSRALYADDITGSGILNVTRIVMVVVSRMGGRAIAEFVPTADRERSIAQS